MTDNLPRELLDFFDRHGHRASPEQPSPPGGKADGEWIYHRSGLPWLLLDHRFPYKRMYVESRRLLPEFIPSCHQKGEGWSSLTLMEEEGAAHPAGWTCASECCPVIKRFFTDEWPYGSVSRVRLMALLPGGYLLPHTDPYELTDGSPHELESFQLSLNTPRGSLYCFENAGLMPWHPGQCHAVDLSHRHALLNRSGKTRIHLIIAHGTINWARMGPLLVRSLYGALAGAA
jgi:hypothetical protein